jgi:hypothetical protein
VLNDDVVAVGMGFSKHLHINIEIVYTPLKEPLKHQDDLGNSAFIKSDKVQIMSVGTGVQHSEKNNNSKVPIDLLQIWVFPKKT